METRVFLATVCWISKFHSTNLGLSVLAVTSKSGGSAAAQAGAAAWYCASVWPPWNAVWNALLHVCTRLTPLPVSAGFTAPPGIEKLVTSGKLVVKLSRTVPGYRSLKSPILLLMIGFPPRGLHANPARG